MPYQFFNVNEVYRWRETKCVGYEKTKAPNGSQIRWSIVIEVKLTKMKFWIIVVMWPLP